MYQYKTDNQKAWNDSYLSKPESKSENSDEKSVYNHGDRTI